MLARVVGTLLLVSLSTLVGVGAAQDVHPLTYEQFAALTPDQREERFLLLEDGNKADLLRQHVQVWLERNRWRLSRGQIAIVEELGALLVERFANPGAIEDPAFNKRVDALGLGSLDGGKANCRLRQSDVWAVLGPMVPPLPAGWGWRDDMWAWLEHCVAPKVLK